MDVITQQTGYEAEPLLSPDADLAHRVRLYLEHAGHRPIQIVKVESHNGIVTLRGRVPSYYIRQLAIACAQRVAGVRAVNDQIRALVPVAKGTQHNETQCNHPQIDSY